MSFLLRTALYSLITPLDMKQAFQPETTRKDLSAEARDFRLLLQAELVRRCNQNPRYSLRAFARMLEIEPSALSKILSGKRGISRTKFKCFVEKLGLEPSVTKSLSPSRRLRKAPEPKQPHYQQLTLDSFQVIADWYHYAILELTHVEGFDPHPKWIARVLGISVPEVSAAVERLRRLEFLEITQEGNWIDQSGSITTVGNDFTAIAFKKLQKAVLEKALVALEEFPLASRDQTSMTMAIDSGLLPEAKERIRNFRRDLAAFLIQAPHRDQVYHLGISLYPITRIEKKAPQVPGGNHETS